MASQTILTSHSATIAGLVDPQDLLVVTNEEGIVSARPFVKERPGADARNFLRKILYINRLDYVAATMQEVVLVPEGRTDWELLGLLSRAVELSSYDAGAHDFGARVGVVPTHDATVFETVSFMQELHKNVIAVVDGDGDGDRYRDRLLAECAPMRVVQWKTGTTIEDVMMWILSADLDDTLAEMQTLLPELEVPTGSLVNWMKVSPKEGGIKADSLCYEALVSAIGSSERATARAGELLTELCRIALGNREVELFEITVQQDGFEVWRFGS